MGPAPGFASPASANILSAAEQEATDALYLRKDGSNKFSGDLLPSTDGARTIGSATLTLLRVYTRFITPDSGQSLILEDGSDTDVITIADAGDLTLSPTGDIILNPAGLQVQVPDDVQFTLGSSNDTVFEHDTAQTNDHLVIGVSDGADTQIILITQQQRIGTNFAMISSWPVLVIHDGSAATLNRGALYHDGTNFNIDARAGDIVLDPVGNNVLPGSNNADTLGAAGMQWVRVYTGFLTPGTGLSLILEDASGNDVLTIADAGALTLAPATNVIIADAVDIAFNTSTGTKIGTGSTEKLSLWGATPVVQPAHVVDADGTLADITTKFNQVLADLATMGAQAAA